MSVLIGKKMINYEYNKLDIYKEVMNIVSVNTSSKFRCLGISSELFKELLVYAEKECLAIRRSLPTEDNINYISKKFDEIELKNNKNVFIINYNESQFFEMFNNVINSFEPKLKNLNSINQDYIKEYGLFIDFLKESNKNQKEIISYFNNRFENKPNKYNKIKTLPSP
jgi:hypothetical protein